MDAFNSCVQSILIYSFFLPFIFSVTPRGDGTLSLSQAETPNRGTPGKRTGPKTRKGIEKRPAKRRPTTRSIRSYTREFKLRVCQWLQDVQNFFLPKPKQTIPMREGLTWYKSPDGRKLHPPTDEMAAAWFKIPRGTVGRWWRSREAILQQPSKTRKDCRQVKLEAFPRMESELYNRFLHERKAHHPVSQAWFRRQALKLHQQLYPNGPLFKCSRGWFRRVIKRWNIARRRITKQATKTPEQQYTIVNSFLRFIRRHSYGLFGVNRFHPSRIMNMDETPIPFEYLEGYTYEEKGVKTVAVKTIRSGWGKRQATLILYIFADGKKRLPPKLIFHGAENGTIGDNEAAEYDTRVTWEYNLKAYNNEKLMLKWLTDEVLPLLQTTAQLPFMLVLDQASFHRTQAVLGWLKTYFVTPAVIPSGCTSLLQPLDTAINKAFKALLSKATERLTHDEDISLWSARARRILTTKAVAIAWSELPEDLIVKSFVECGININPRGRENYKVRIKDLPNVSWIGWDTEYQPEYAVKLEEEEELELDPACDGDLFISSDGADGHLLNEIVYFNMKKDILKELCRARGMLISGNKPALIARLLAGDQNQQQSQRSRGTGSRRDPIRVYEDISDPPGMPSTLAGRHSKEDLQADKENQEPLDLGYYSQR